MWSHSYTLANGLRARSTIACLDTFTLQHVRKGSDARACGLESFVRIGAVPKLANVSLYGWAMEAKDA